KVRQGPRPADAPDHGRCLAGLPAPRRPTPSFGPAGPADQFSRQTAALQYRAVDLPETAASLRHCPTLGGVPAPDPRSAAQLRRQYHCRRLPDRRPRLPPRDPVHLPRSCRSRRYLLVPVGRAGIAGAGRRTARAPSGGQLMSALATTLQAFFTDRLVRQRQVSPNTVQAYRDTLRLLLVFASERHGKAPGKLDIDDLDAPLIGAFLDHLEHERQNGVRTRNARLAAIRSLFRYAALRHPEHAATIERVLAIPPKRFERRLVTWLTEAEIDALLAAPDRATWTGRRDT